MKTLTVLFLLFASMFVHAQEYAIRQLEDSPRHHEWVVVKSNGRNLHCFVAYPEIAEKAPVVIVIHENRGLNDWARSLTDQLAAAGYLAIAPDLLSGASREYEKTKDYPTTDAAREAIYRLDADAVTADLDAVFAYAKTINAGNGKIHVMGFCWGGSQSFRFATNNSGLTAAFVFYGTGPNDQDAISRINVPVYGFYGGNDNRVNATLEETERLMEAEGKEFVYEIYEGAGHAFMRSGDDPEGEEANVKARNDSWERIRLLLGRQ